GRSTRNEVGSYTFWLKMSDELAEKVSTAFSQIPPWPPREQTSGDGGDRSMLVQFSQVATDGTGASERLAQVIFDPRRSRSTHETLSPQGVPQLFVKLFYSADTGGLNFRTLTSGR